MASNNIKVKIVSYINSLLNRKKHAINSDTVHSHSCSTESLNTWDIIPDIEEQNIEQKASDSNDNAAKKKPLHKVIRSEIMHCSTDSGYSDIEDDYEIETGLALAKTGVNKIAHTESIRIPDIPNECDKYVNILVNTSRSSSNNVNLESEEIVERNSVKNTYDKFNNLNIIITDTDTSKKITTNDISLINFNQYSCAYKNLVKTRLESSSENQFNDISNKCIDLSDGYQLVNSSYSKTWISPHSGSTYNGIMDMKNVHSKGQPQYKETKWEKTQAHEVHVCGDLNNNDKLLGYSTRAKRLIRKSKYDSGAKFRSLSGSRKSNKQETSVPLHDNKVVKQREGVQASGAKFRNLSETRCSSRKSNRQHETVFVKDNNTVVDKKKQIVHQEQLLHNYQNKDSYLENLKVRKEQQISLVEKRRIELHKMIDSWYEQLHNQLEFTYEQEYDRVSKSSDHSDTDSEDTSSAFKSPSTMMCSVLNTHTSLYPQDFGTFNTQYVQADWDPDIWAYEMKEAIHLRTFESRDNDVYTEYMATSLTVNKEGNFTVSDLGADTCRLFSPEGQLLSDFDVYPLSEPSNVLPLDNGSYMVSCRDGLQLFNSKGEHKGNRDIPKDIKCPQCVAVDKKGNYIVSDMHDCGSVIITLEKESLLPLRMFCGSQFHESPMCFKKAWYIHVKQDDAVILSDRDDHIVKCYSKHGEFQWSIGGLGSKNGQFVTPAGITEDKFGNIIVADCGNDRVQIFSANGDWLGELISDNSHGIISPTDVVITKDGNLAVLQSNGTVSVFKYLHKLT